MEERAVSQEGTNRSSGLTAYLVVLIILNGSAAIGNAMVEISMQQATRPADAETAPAFFLLALCCAVNIGAVIAVWHRKKWGIPLFLISGVAGLAITNGLFHWGTILLTAAIGFGVCFLLLSHYLKNGLA